MFLALTPQSEWWDKDAEILLLGAWCRSYGARKELASLRVRMLPSPWEDRQRFETASAYLKTVHDRLLHHLATYLNNVHGVEEPLDYWRVLIGAWLLYFVHAAYDRYTHLSDALSLHPGLQTAVLDSRCFRTPRTTSDTVRWLGQDDHYNWQLLSEMLPLLGSECGRRTCYVPPDGAARLRTPRGESRLVSYLERARSRVLGAVDTGRRGLLTDVTASRASLLAIAVRSGFRVIPFPVRDELSSLSADPVCNERRTNLHALPASDDFERACIRLLPRHFPTIYLEGYDQARRATRRRYPRPPRLLVSDTAWFENESYKYFAAAALVLGTRLVTVQHGGGGYGMPRWAPQQALEIEIGHAYFVWGWADGASSVRNVPHPLLSRHPRPVRFRPRNRILFAPQSAERYLFRLESRPIGTQLERHWAWQLRFVDALPGAVRRRLVLRTPPADYGQDIQRRLTDRHPQLQNDTCATFKRSVARSRITVVEKFGTCLLESLVMNAPTVLFLNLAHYDLRDDVAPYVEALRRAGILWDSPESAAAHVASVYDDTGGWWKSESVQATRGAFVERFALARRDWAGCWVRALDHELASASGPREEPSSVESE